MAKIVPVRPKWMRREAVVVYVSDDQMRARSRAEKINNPRTEAQQLNRQKFAVAANFLRQMQCMVSVGFRPEYTARNGRKCGAYHVAQGALMRSGMRLEVNPADGKPQWCIDYPRVRLAQGQGMEDYPMSVARRGRVLTLVFPRGLPRGVGRLRVAVHCPGVNATCHVDAARLGAGEGLQITVPEGFVGQDLHCYYMVEGGGRPWGSAYVFVEKDRGRGGRSSVSLGEPSRLLTTFAKSRKKETMKREQDRGKMWWGKLPCGVQSFEEMRSDGYAYVDKTDLIWEMAHDAKVQFFARPRRFGKSLMISTLKSYFEGRGDLFEGLKVEEKRREVGETEWVKHPVFTFGFSGSSFTERDAIRTIFDRLASPYEERYGIRPKGHIGDRIATLINVAYQQEGVKPVILVDEYDNPLTDTLSKDKEALHYHYKDELRGFYKAIKECSGMLHLVVITGITQFSDLSLFSGINQLRNLSFSPKYAALFGITEEELIENFPEEIGRMAEMQGLDFDGMVGRLRVHYDGYRFTRRDVHVYNPQSIIFALDEMELEPFWASSGTSRLLATVFPTYDYDFAKLSRPIYVTQVELTRLDESGRNPIPLLFQSGYLTIAGVDTFDAYGGYELRFPNREVRTAFWEVVLPLYGPKNCRMEMLPFIRQLHGGEVAEAMERLRGLLAGVAYSTMARKKIEQEGGDGREGLYEELFQTALYAWFSALGMLVRTEVYSLKGRSDVEVHIGDRVFIFELKVGPMVHSAEDALAEIKEQGYAEKHRGQGKRVVIIGVSIDTRRESRGEMEWASEEA
ncbi:MAG: hypothetical protein CSA97_01990 [Bacteroidetes bacterium]|nr:MAG: hypothetical protein CSA97_01990 [Bacteroidota bacterium]